MAQFYLPKIGDGLGGTVAPGSIQLATAGTTEQAEILDCVGRRVAALSPRTRKLFIAIDDTQRWSFSDHPNSFPAADVTDLPAGGGGPHKLTHQTGGIDEISVAGLAGLLANPQAPLSHSHIVADTTGLQTFLDGKASVVHSHVIADVTSLQAGLDAKAALSHTHAQSDVTNLASTLATKAALAHTHPQADVVGLVSALSFKSDVGHTHPASEIASGVLAIARIPTGQTSSTVPLGDDARFVDARTPLAHAASHKSGGADAIKLDELAAPTDITTLNASTAQHGLLPKLLGGVDAFLRADGTYQVPSLSGVSVVDQTINAGVTAYLADSKIIVPTGKLRIRTVLRWTISLSKTAAGTAANTFHVRIGTAGTTADAAVLTFALPVGTGVIDVGLIEIVVTIRGPLSAACIAQGHLGLRHNLSATGLATVPCVHLNVTSAGFDATVANLIAGISCTTAASTVLTFQEVVAESLNL